MASISSPGLGSGLDITSLVSQLVAAEGQPTLTRLANQEASLQARLSGLGQLKSAISTFQGRLAGLASLSAFQSNSATISDEDVLGASTTDAAATGVYNINTTKLAQAHALVTDQLNPFAATTETIGTGELTIRFGSDPTGSFQQNIDRGTHTITVDSSNNTLEGLRDAINDADIGINATIINNGSGYLLSFASDETGADAAIQITVDDTGDGSDIDANGLSRLAYNATAANLEQTVTAQDAVFSINGVNITSSTNSVSTAIEGVTLNLLDTGTSTLTISQDSSVVRASVEAFVDGYNTLINTTNELTRFDPETGFAAILNGDFGIRSIIGQVQRQIGSLVPGLDGSLTSLSAIGVRTGEDGNLTIDSAELDDAISTNPSGVAKLFAAVGDATDNQVTFSGSSLDTQVGTYDINITQAATQGVITGNATASLADDGAGNFSSAFVIDADNDSFTIEIDGIESNTINLTQGSYTTTASLVAEIQARLNADSNLAEEGVSATVSFDAATDQISITSTRFGSASTVEFTSVDTNSAAELGFDTALTGTDGLNVAGTIGGVTASGNGTQLTALSGDADGLVIEVPGGVSGSLGSISFTRGVADTLSQLAQTLLDDNVFDDRIDAVQDTIDSIDDQREVLDRRLESVRARLLRQFTALDVLVNQLQNTSSFITQQLASLPTVSAGGGGQN